MQLKDKIGASGKLHIVLRDKDGNIKEERTVPNLIVEDGEEHIADQFGQAAQSPMSHMAVGSGAVAEVATDTALGTELGRVALASKTTAANVTTFTATFGAGVATGSVQEAGIFNAAAAGVMLNRATFGVFTKEASDVMTISWAVTINGV